MSWDSFGRLRYYLIHDINKALASLPNTELQVLACQVFGEVKSRLIKLFKKFHANYILSRFIISRLLRLLQTSHQHEIFFFTKFDRQQQSSKSKGKIQSISQYYQVNVLAANLYTSNRLTFLLGIT